MAALVMAVAVLAVVLAPGVGGAGATVSYLGGGTLVAKQGGQPATADEGAVVCNQYGDFGIGGGCLPFDMGLKVTDSIMGTQVAFQVCIDNNGDGVCSAPPQRGEACPDDIFFSHGDDGTIYNPMRLPSGFLFGCGSQVPWRGYVVFLCEGVHNATPGPHVHPATTGTIEPWSASAPLPQGDFCGGTVERPTRKSYVVT